uniref:DUF29 domain-containing protein n=1 Tax=Candidatus Kentrum sp. TUN TaxID=2126343 RepID=A0A450ZLU3_9GAMM|nr:MAG: protein of unknown function DUF29 [Candidatus Kentron sp. TUN]VFK59200.1 MAG: protein of unknown function DUF29 [Candidatus Kentron sp. TUN]
MQTTAEYNQDFYAWLMTNAELLRAHDFTGLDAENIAEELEAMGKQEKRELINRLAVLLTHLLKWKFQSHRRSKSWRNTIVTQRIDILALIEDSPSLKYEIGGKIDTAYEKARLGAENETGIDKENFPEICPFTLEELLTKDFFPK